MPNAMKTSVAPHLVVATLLMAAPAGAAIAADKTVDTVLSASVDASGHAGTVILRSRARLDNTCLSHPRFRPGPKMTADATGVVTITVKARSSEGPGVMCAMHVTDVDVPPLILKKSALAGVKSIRVTGSRQPALAAIDTAP